MEGDDRETEGQHDQGQMVTLEVWRDPLLVEEQESYEGMNAGFEL